MNRKISKWIIVFMVMAFAVSQICTGVFAEEMAVEGEIAVEPADTGGEEIPADPGAGEVVEPAVNPGQGEIPPSEPEPVSPEPVPAEPAAPEPVAPEPAVVEPTAPAEPVTELPSEAQPGTSVHPEPTQTAAEPASTGNSTQDSSMDGYDTEGIDPSELESYLYEMGMGEWADSISDSDGNNTWGLNTLTRDPAELKGYNFALFGLSGENSGDDGRSDTIIICTIDPERQEIKLTSILRDTKASIEGHEPQKINAAHKIGGPELAVDTLNRNFGLTLKDYITVQFDTLIDIVDIVGGIEVELNQDEADFINEYSTEYGLEPLTEGVQLLNGWQAVLYCRIRKIDSDKVRAGRQQLVIRKIFEKLRGQGFLQWFQIVMKVMQTSKISIPLETILDVIRLPLGEYTLVNNIIPDIDYETDLKTAIDEHGEWVWLYDLGKAGDRIVDIINNQ